jgi:hypothetical protein
LSTILKNILADLSFLAKQVFIRKAVGGEEEKRP